MWILFLAVDVARSALEASICRVLFQAPSVTQALDPLHTGIGTVYWVCGW